MEKELAINNLKLSADEQENLRKRIVRMMRKHNETGKVAEICECSVRHVQSTWKKYLEGGTASIKIAKKGRKINSGALSEAQQCEIQKLIVDKCPEQIKLPGFLWDRSNVAALIKQKYKIKLTVQAVGKYLKKWGFTPQRPVKSNYRQKPEAVRRWLEEEYPKVKERAKKEKAEIAWGDETGVQNECNYVKGYAPKGKTPVMPFGEEKLRVNMISAITNQGKLRYMFYRDSMTQQRFIEFMSRLIKDEDKKVFFIVDNLKVHHGKLVQAWLSKHKPHIEVFYLPSYSPEYNPDEYLNGNLKRNMAKRGFSKTAGELESKARSTMKKLQVDKTHIINFFKADKVKYALD
jgi:transposase